MPGQLFIRLQGNGHATWLELDSNGQVSGIPGFGELSEAAGYAGGNKVVVIVPGHDVTLARVNMPTRSRQKILQGIPFVMEDQVIEDIDHIHFAVGSRLANNQIAIAMVSRKQMHTWSAMLDHAGITASAMVPDNMTVPAINGNWCVLLDGDNALVRTGELGFVTERENLPLMLPRAVKEQETNPPHALDVIDCAKDEPPDASMLGIDADVSFRHCEQGALSVLARNYHNESAINLLQGEFSKAEQIGRKWKPWLPAITMAGVFLILQFGGMVTEYFSIASQQHAINGEIKQIFRKTFPNKRLRDAVKQMRIELKALQGSGNAKSKIGMLQMLSELGPVFAKSSNINLKRMHFKDGRIDLELQLPNVKEVEQMMSGLKVLNQYVIDPPTLSNRGDMENVRLKIQQK